MLASLVCEAFPTCKPELIVSYPFFCTGRALVHSQNSWARSRLSCGTCSLWSQLIAGGRSCSLAGDFLHIPMMTASDAIHCSAGVSCGLIRGTSLWPAGSPILRIPPCARCVLSGARQHGEWATRRSLWPRRMSGWPLSLTGNITSFTTPQLGDRSRGMRWSIFPITAGLLLLMKLKKDSSKQHRGH